ncbi:MAG: cytochrome b/b6 domain-containing protein [Roseitalea porphyridii]|uniref:cytochrome b/b6 domain-containing protein n=1 Tax=Roseitalea porphyridii TaxID=1852022 RepID=UPI0032D982A0
MMSDLARESAGVRVWDPLVRLTHWGIALAVLVNGILLRDGDIVHIWIGYGALALLLLRLFWGFIGTESARFSAFPPNLRGALAHLRSMTAGRHSRYRSHNPLGALMVYALWATLLVVATTGVLMQSDPFPQETHQERYEHVEHERGGESEAGEAIEEVHEAAANLLLLLAALHVIGAFAESRLSGQNLIAAMITGRRS